ncbi:WXG100 family type VII secretion target [Mycobacterium sp. URHD0025]|uniref:WXG100 family type VII secretion target n=1 Tax=Mycobacterium sp. URHD0025 TaxID=1298864 RepID=UPI0003FF79BA|nr:WXG100 family type VII secretion target [Mycobacterium sp. URHD0025]
MAYTVSKIRNSKPDVLSTAATDAETSAQRVNSQIAQGREQMSTLREDWIGTASDAAGKQYGELIGYQQAYSQTFATLKAALSKHGPKLVGYKAKLDTAVNEAEGRWDVADGGSVSLGRMLKLYLYMNPTQWFKIEAMRIEVENHPRDDTDYFMLPEKVNAEQARQAALMTYIFNAGTGYGSSRGNINNDFAETPYSAAEVQRIKDRQAANSWSYDLLEHATGRFAATPNGMLMGVGGGPIQQTVSQQAGTCVGDIFAVNMDHPPHGPAQELRNLIQSGTSTWQADDGTLRQGNDIDRILHHEERHSQQWAHEGRANFLRQYFWPTDADPNPFESNAGGSDGGYH